MKSPPLLAAAAGLVLLACADRLRGQDDALDRLDSALSFASADGVWRARLSGALDLEAYDFQQPAPGFIRSGGTGLFSPRLSLFLDAQAGPSWYFFAQSRLDRGFDPNASVTAQFRLDEYAVRYSPHGDPRLHLQAGKFATVIGNWTPRHDSWSNPFVTAPLPYDALTGVWDALPVRSTQELLEWSHVAPFPAAVADTGKLLRLPIIWGPDYTTGAAVAGDWGPVSYAAEIKNAALASRPETWQPTATQWGHPTWSGRIALNPNPMWQVGFSGSEGAYLRPAAAPFIPPGIAFGRYREIVFGEDAAFAWHHAQLWAEAYEARFAIPAVTNADTVAYYVEARYTFAPRIAAAIRWNQQLFGTVPVAGVETRWGMNANRIDLAPEYRLSAHIQLKIQYSLQTGDPGWPGYGRLWASQLTIRF